MLRHVPSLSRPRACIAVQSVTFDPLAGQNFYNNALAHISRVTRFGLLLVPTEAFARSLCEVGRQRARAKGRHAYSGMIHFEKVRREFEHMTKIVKMPFGVIGVDRNGEN